MLVEAMESWRPEIEDGLTLFQHMRAREHRNYLDNCNDDIEEIKYEGGLSTFRISGSTPTRKGGGGLLISDIDKSDYDWLLTPPGTPLFPSLDQETASINFAQRTTLTCSGPTSKSSKDSSSKPLSESPSPHQTGAVFSRRNTTCAYVNPSPQRSFAASPARPSASSSRAKSPSASPSPSLTRSHPTTGAFSPSRSITPTGRLPATASKSTSRPSTPTLCRNNTSPSSASRRGYLAPKGPRRSLSPSLGPWEPVMAVLSTEPLPNLRTSPSSRSLQRGKSECSSQGITNSKDFDTCHDSQCAIELVAWRNRNKGPNNTLETGKLSTRCEDSRYNSSPARRQPQPATCTKEVISSFANGKLIERQVSPGRNSQNMFRPLMMNAPSTSIYRTCPDVSNHNMPNPPVLPSTSMNASPKQSLRISPERGSSHDSDKQGKDPRGICSVVIDPGKLEGTEDSGIDLSHASDNCILLDEAFKEPTKFECKPREETGLEGAWGKNNQTSAHEGLKNDSACKDIQVAEAQEFTRAKLLNSDTDGVKSSDSLIKGISQKHRKHILLAHSFSGESQMQNVRFSRGYLNPHTREDNKVLASDKVQSPLRYKLNKDDVKPAFDSFFTQAFTHCTGEGTQDGAHSTSFHPVRRQLCMKNADMVYGMWNMKKAGSFDISTSDSYSCSESLDSSYVDNHTEKFSEDLSEVDSMSQTGYSLSTSSMTNHPFYNLTCAEKPFTQVSTELGMGEARFMKLSGGLESEPPIEYYENEQSLQSRVQSQPCKVTDCSVLWPSSDDFPNQTVVDGNGLSAKDVHSLLDACNIKLLGIEQSTAGKLCTQLDVKGEYATRMLTLVAENGDAGKDHASKSIFAGAVAGETTECDDDLKKMQPQASPLRRNVTLEEATDTILFCSSIIHEIVYKVATLGEEKCTTSIGEHLRELGHNSGPSPLRRTSKSWSRNKREPACIRTQPPLNHGLQSPRIKHVLMSNKAVLPAAHEAGKTSHKRKKKALCGFGFCRVM